MKLTCLGIWGAYPEAGSATTSFLLEEKGFKLLIDCGSGVLAQMQKIVPVEELDALVLSHYHHDHVADLGCMQYALLINTLLGKRKDSLPIYAHREGPFESLSYQTYSHGVEISAERKFMIGPWEVSFCPTVHPAYCLAMKFTSEGRSIVYSADTGWCDELVEFSKGANLLICESSLYNEQKGQVSGHMTGGEAGQLAQLAEVQALILAHFPHYGEHQRLVEQAREEFSGPVQLASELKSWVVK